MDELINFGGTAEGCPVCVDRSIHEPPFASDAALVAHLVQHSLAELAWALLVERATVQRILVAVDEPGGIEDERDLEELMKEVEYTAERSPGRPR
jgi:hypothetical protein